jgi:hypothetical protein
MVWLWIGSGEIFTGKLKKAFLFIEKILNMIKNYTFISIKLKHILLYLYYLTKHMNQMTNTYATCIKYKMFSLVLSWSRPIRRTLSVITLPASFELTEHKKVLDKYADFHC